MFVAPRNLGREITGEETVKGVLRNLGLTEKEAAVYVFLSKRGVLKCGEIAKGMKRHTSQIYRILKILQTKGLLESTLEAPTRFTAVPFETVLDLSIKAKRDEATQMERTRQEILSYWKNVNQPRLDPSLEKFVVIEGNSKIYPKISQMIKDTKNQLSAVSTVSGLLRADQFGVFDAILTHPLRPKIQFRFLTELSQQSVSAIKAFFKKMKNAELNLEGRVPDLGLRSFPRMIIRDEEESLIFIAPRFDTAKQDEVCLWTNSKSLVQAFTAIFEELWHNATDTLQKIVNIETGKPTQKTFTISDAEIAEKIYNETLRAAKKEIVVLASPNGLLEWCKNIPLLKEWAEKDVAVKIMAPVTSENIEAAEQLLKVCAVRHVTLAYLETTIVDGKQLFQFKTPPHDQKKSQATLNFENTFYTNDLQQVKRAKIMLTNIWKSASYPSALTLKTAVSPPPPFFVSPEAFKAFLKARKKTPPIGPATVGQATIYPPNNLNMPAIKIQAYDWGKDPLHERGNSLIVYLRLRRTEGYDFVPVAIVETNAGVVAMQKTLFTGTPAAENLQLVRPDELQIRKQGSTLFAGWTVQIPLPPTTHYLSPSCILFEAYGTARHVIRSAPEPSGHIAAWEADTSDAFIAFLDPSWKYAGPGTQGTISTNATFTLSEPG